MLYPKDYLNAKEVQARVAVSNSAWAIDELGISFKVDV